MSKVPNRYMHSPLEVVKPERFGNDPAVDGRLRAFAQAGRAVQGEDLSGVAFSHQAEIKVQLLAAPEITGESRKRCASTTLENAGRKRRSIRRQWAVC